VREQRWDYFTIREGARYEGITNVSADREERKSRGRRNQYLVFLKATLRDESRRYDGEFEP